MEKVFPRYSSGSYPRDSLPQIYNNIFTNLFAVALFLIIEYWKQPKFLSMETDYINLPMQYHVAIKRKRQISAS